MADAAVNTPQFERGRLGTQHVAWATVLLAFAMFSVICLVSGVGLHYFLFKSTIPMQTTLTVGRGTTIVTGTNLNITPVRDSQPQALDNRSIVSTEAGGQAMLTFYDEQQSERRILASATLTSDSSLRLAEVSQPRFSWSTTDYIIYLSEFSGRLELLLANGDIPPIEMRVTTAQGATIEILESGRYSITANQAQVRVETISGLAELTVGPYKPLLGDGERVMYTLNTEELTRLAPYTNLIANNTFNEGNIFASSPPPSAWGCFNAANDSVLGSFGLAIEDGRPALHFYRTGSNQHGESSCSVAFTSDGQSGVDVSQYESISLDVTFKLMNQSVSGCGDLASECLLMIEMHYVPANNVNEARLWHHGFYLWNSDPDLSLTCSTCTQEHELVNGNVWYRYRSDNLFATFPLEQRPVKILALRIYSSGHEYDAYVSEVSLLASERIDTVPLGDPSLQG